SPRRMGALRPSQAPHSCGSRRTVSSSSSATRGPRSPDTTSSTAGRGSSGGRTPPDEADVLVFNTCTIREKPDTKLAAYLGEAAARKRRQPDLVVAVGGGSGGGRGRG